MRRLKWVLWSSLLLLALLWLLTEPGLRETQSFFGWRNLLVQLSGILAMGCMSLAMLLALRPQWLESWLDGLDKMYRLHKWLGVAALVTGMCTGWPPRGPNGRLAGAG